MSSPSPFLAVTQCTPGASVRFRCGHGAHVGTREGCDTQRAGARCMMRHRRSDVLYPVQCGITSARGQRQCGQRRRPSTALGGLPMVETPLAERPRARCCADGDVPGSVLPATAVPPACGSQACPPVGASNRSCPHRGACCVVQGPRVVTVGPRCASGVSGRDRRTHAWPQWTVIGAHSGPDQSVGAPVRAGPVRRRFFRKTSLERVMNVSEDGVSSFYAKTQTVSH